jgi:hypothetical protein
MLFFGLVSDPDSIASDPDSDSGLYRFLGLLLYGLEILHGKSRNL